MRFRPTATLTIALFVTAGVLHCQAGTTEQDSPPEEPSSTSTPAPMTVEDVMHTRQRTQSVERGFGRWFDVSTAAVAVRYRLLVPPEGATRTSQAQNTVAFRGRLKLDAPGRYAVSAGLATGQGFRGGWNNTGIGTGQPAYDLLLKELFVVARPVDRLEVQVGGLHLVRGESTEATSYDNDGYVVGERLTVGRVVTKMFDEVSVTRAFLGDLDQSNVFDRLRRLDRANYYQALALKRVAPGTAVSVDYTWQDGVDVIRAAMSVVLKHSTLVDRFRFENYARAAPFPAYGYAFNVQRRLSRRLTAGGGISDIDDRYGALNSDLNGLGRRIHGSMSARLGTVWVGSIQLVRTVGEQTITGPRTRVEVALGYDAVSARSWRRANR